MVLRADHASRPIWVTRSGRIYLETFSSIYKQAYDFLIGIAEPITRYTDAAVYLLCEKELLVTRTAADLSSFTSIK